MAHFAQLDDKNIVTQVIVVGDVDTSDNSGTVSYTHLRAHETREYIV